MNSVLLVDDDRTFSALAAAALEQEELEVTCVHSLHEARQSLAKRGPDLLILDRRLPDGDGLDFLKDLSRRKFDAPVIMVTAYGDIASAVDAIQAGAVDYLTKPVELADLVLKALRGLEGRRLRERLDQAEAQLWSRHRMVEPQSVAMRRVLEVLGRVAATPRSPVLLLGETGSGKEALARRFHALAHGDDAPFVHLNCAAVPESTFESELFGHERGAFTDAKSSRRGLVEVASGGTLFLDEVGELPLPLQAKLLTFLDDGAFRRLGGTTALRSSARIVAATNRDLERLVQEGGFREDLWFRLSVFRVDIPPLRERCEDILPLAKQLLGRLAHELGLGGRSLSHTAKERLAAYLFPGNVRELRNILERSLVLEPGPRLELEMLSGAVESGGGPRQPSPARSAGVSADDPASASDVGTEFVIEGAALPLLEVEKRYARHVLEQLGGRRMDAAKGLGISYPTFLKRIEGDGEGG